MTKRERVIRALKHKESDITPYHLDFTTPVREKLVEYYYKEEIDAGGGYVLAPAHATPKDVPPANVLAMIETLQNQ